jgi:hypothetical protein
MNTRRKSPLSAPRVFDLKRHISLAFSLGAALSALWVALKQTLDLKTALVIDLFLSEA